MPLDLHVLGLSLAFILSQDQTLRCNIYFFLFLTPVKADIIPCSDARIISLFSWRGLLPPPVSQRGPSLSTFLSVYRNTFNDLLHFLAPLEARKFCKDKTFFVSAPNFSKSFFELFQNYTLVSFFAISLPSRSPRSKSGAKIKLFIYNIQIFEELFLSFFLYRLCFWLLHHTKIQFGSNI